MSLALPGVAILITLGQKTVFGDRELGDYWMEYEQVSPALTGRWILTSLAIAPLPI
jgi:hypothetical protein